MSKVEDYLKQPIPVKEYLLEYFNASDELVILDIGACEGLDSIKYSWLFPCASIYAFEPLAYNIEVFRKYLSEYNIQNVEIVQEALSDTIGTADFYVSSGHPQNAQKDWDYGNKSSSLLQPDQVKNYHSWLEFNEKVKVPTNTLANFLNKYKINSVDIIHLDVQGAEIKVLQGAEHHLQKFNFIWMEVENVSLYAGQPLKKDVERFMRKKGFKKIMDTVSKVSGDQLYIRRSLLKKESRILKKIKKTFKRNKKAIESFHKMTYSQCGEDIIIQHLFRSLKINQPTYIDIGAHHPQKISNTALFYKNGSRGINIEPDPLLFQNFLKHRKEDINLNIGVSDSPGEMELYIMSAPTLNTFSKEDAIHYVNKYDYKIAGTKKVKVDTLHHIIEKYSNGQFPDFLSLDVEGLDEEILRSINYEKSDPSVICVETVSFSTNRKGEKQENIISFLKDKGYMIYADTYINTIFVKKDIWFKEE